MRLHEVQLLCEAIASVEQWIDREAGRGREVPRWMTVTSERGYHRSPFKIWFETAVKNLSTLEKMSTVEVEKKVKEFFKSAFVTSYEKWLEREELFGHPVPEGEIGRIKDWFNARLRGKLSELRKFSATAAMQATNEYHDRVFAQQEQGIATEAGLSEAPVVYESKRWVVRMPKTHEATCFFGRGTRWCITMKNDYHYRNYLGRGEKFFLLEDKVSPQIEITSVSNEKTISSRVKYAFIPEKGEYRDNADAMLTSEQIHDILYSDQGLKEFMIKNLPSLDNRFMKALEPQDKETLFEKMDPDGVVKYGYTQAQDADIVKYGLKRGGNPVNAQVYSIFTTPISTKVADEYIDNAKPEALLKFAEVVVSHPMYLGNSSLGLQNESGDVPGPTGKHTGALGLFRKAIKKGADVIRAITPDSSMSLKILYAKLTPEEKESIIAKTPPDSALLFAVKSDDVHTAQSALNKGAEISDEVIDEAVKNINLNVLPIIVANAKNHDDNEYLLNGLITAKSAKKKETEEYAAIVRNIVGKVLSNNPDVEWLYGAIDNNDIPAVAAMLDSKKLKIKKTSDLAALAGEKQASDDMINYLIDRIGPPVRYDLTSRGEVAAYKKGKGYYVEFDEYSDWAPLFEEGDARELVEKLFGGDSFGMFERDTIKETYSNVDHLLSKENLERIQKIIDLKQTEDEDYDPDDDEELTRAISHAYTSAKEAADEDRASSSVLESIFEYMGLDYGKYKQIIRKNGKRAPVRQVMQGKYKGNDGNEYDKWKFVASISQDAYKRMYTDSIGRDYLEAEPPIEFSKPYYGWDGDISKEEDYGFNDLLSDNLNDLD